jgi:long-chain acyl-CoA synthetase
MRETRRVTRHENLLGYFRPEARPSAEIAVAWRRGYRMERWRWAQLHARASQFARELETQGIARGDRVLLWGDNTGEWLAVFIGCLLRGAVVVPMDAIASPDFARRVAADAGIRFAAIARALPPPAGAPSIVLEDLPEAVGRHSSAPYASPELRRDDVLEIVFTSGTTAEPRGVVLTHGNVLSNIEPIETEIAKYRRYERFFHPLKFLNLLPLSHVFGQILGIFISQILGATVIFLDSIRPGEVAETIRRERVSVLISVPRLIESLRDKLERDIEAEGRIGKFRRDFTAAEKEHFLKRWWRFRRIRSRYGWKFWAIISGGAALASDPEKFWTRLGYAVIQGYGLTETTSLVSVNHPFRLGEGSIGKALPGLEVKLDANGEIMVRGQNVAAGYWRGGRVESARDEEGWFRTGDLGERDGAGNLYFRGRQKNVIVTPEGMNIFPGDLEAELRKDPRVRDCVVIGVDLKNDGNAEPCAVLLLRDSAGDSAGVAEAIVRNANASLASFQQIRRWLVWRDADFPRTPTQKPLLAKIRETVLASLGGAAPASAGTPASASPRVSSNALAELIAKITNRPDLALSADADLSADLNLSSVDRVELLSELEERYQVDLSEARFAEANTVKDIERLVGQPPEHGADFVYPRWAQSWPVKILRQVVYYALTWPATMIMAMPRVRGREKLRNVPGPALVISNHVTYLDVGFLLKALPMRLRHHLATAMDGERLDLMRRPPQGTFFLRAGLDRLKYFLVVALFNVFPLPRRSGYRQSFAYAGELIGRGESVVIFPEGELTRDGTMDAFRPGIGLLATHLEVPVIPMRIDGLFPLRERRQRFSRPGTVRVTIGEPVRFASNADPEEVTRELQKRVAALGDDGAN